MERRNDFRKLDGKHCPTCGHTIDTSGILFDRHQGIVVYRGKIADLGTGQRSVIFAALLDAYPNAVHRDTLLLKIYDGDEPASSDRCDALAMAMFVARKRLKPLGILITHANGEGLRQLIIEPPNP